MSANRVPITPDAVLLGMVQVTAANTALDGSGTIATVYTAGAAPQNGVRITLITIKAIVATTAGMIRLFIHDGTNMRLWKERPVTLTTPSATVPAFQDEYVPTGSDALLLPPGYSLRASTEKGETFNVFAHGGTF